MSTPAGVFDSFIKLIGITSKRDPQKGTIIYITTSLTDLKMKLEEIRRRLKDRDNELLTNAVKALSSGDRDRASIYASEIAEVRKLIKIVHIALLAIERLLERSKTMNIVNDLRALGTTLGILNELKTMFANTMPELASTLDTIVSNVNMLISTTKSPEISVNVVTKTKEVEEILREVEKQAEEKMRNTLTPIPIQLEDMINIAQKTSLENTTSFINKRSLVETAIPTSYSPHAIRTVTYTSPIHDIDSGLEIQIYNYIVNSKGVINIRECANRFGISDKDVLMILKRLEQKGLIRIS